MSRRILINPVTRIEGHAKITVNLDDSGEVTSAHFHIAEFRGFEKFCEGRPFTEMPGLMARVCGICPVSHVLASSKAGDMLLGVEIPPAAEKQRRLMNYAQCLQSHALSFFHLSSPDLLLGMDAPPAQRNFVGLLADHADFMRRGIRLRQFGQRIIQMVGGRKIHPGWSGPGGVHRRFTEAERDEVLTWFPGVFESLQIALDCLKSLLDSFSAEVESMGNFPSLFMGTVNETGGLEFYEGKLRIIDGHGNAIAENLDPRRYHTYLAEATEPYSYVKFPFYQPFGYPTGHYRVGPLARLNVAKYAGTPRADVELREFKQRGSGAVCESFHYHLARVIEMIHCAERIEELMSDSALFDEDIKARAALNRHEGVGSCEAPRGTLFHQYWVDPNGLMTRANLLIATAQNNQAMNMTVDQAARRFIAKREPDQGALNRLEAAIRCYDPCLSCSSHAIGQMPLVVELRGPSGELLRTLAREN